MTLQNTLTYLTTLARDHSATITTSLQLEFRGVQLAVFWEGADIPREATLYFGHGLAWDDDNPGPIDWFQWACVLDPSRAMAALEEGLTDEQVEDEARRLVWSVGELTNYLLGRPYEYRKMTVNPLGP